MITVLRIRRGTILKGVQYNQGTVQADFGGASGYIPIGCSGRHREVEKQWRVGAR